jgi:acyl-CoA synthetase (AMP-forming)/AMP-acid ligase II
MIKTGGSNVAPAEVEAALREIDGVRYAHVIGLPAGPRGEDVAAVVVPSAAADLRAEDLAARARRLLSSFKVPRRWLVLAEADVPMTATGKPDIQALRARFADTPASAPRPGASPGGGLPHDPAES